MTYLLRVNGEWTFALAISTITDLNLFRRILVEWTENSPTFPAIKLDIFELREDAGS